MGRASCFQAGVTLVELMIALVLGMMVIGAATALLLSTKGGYTAQNEISQLQDTGTYVLESLSRAVRQAAYVDWQSEQATGFSGKANIFGFDASRITGASTTASGLDAPLKDSVVNGSDVLVVHFFGSGTGGNGDGSVIDCAGNGIPSAVPPSPGGDARATSIFYVSTSSSGEPELYCRSQGDSAWSSQSLAQGVESFQVLYGLDTDGDSLPNRFVTATDIGGMEAPGWNTVVSVKLALLIRGTQKARDDALTMTHDLFGKDYGAAYAASDVGTRISEANLSSATRNRIRKVFSATIQLRNQAAGGA